MVVDSIEYHGNFFGVGDYAGKYRTVVMRISRENARITLASGILCNRRAKKSMHIASPKPGSYSCRYMIARGGPDLLLLCVLDLVVDVVSLRPPAGEPWGNSSFQEPKFLSAPLPSSLRLRWYFINLSSVV